MAIVTNTNLNKAPYFDDYDEDKKYVKILFRPGVSIQARELTQLQTMMQKQIERFGRHMFKENSMIIPGLVGLDLGMGYTKIYLNVLDSGGNVTTSPVVPNSLTGMFVEEVNPLKVNLVKAKIQELVYYTDPDTNQNCYVMYLRYSAVGDLNKKAFAQNDLLKVTDSDGVVITFIKALSTADNVGTSAISGTGSKANLNEGIYFSRGYFVKATTQSIFLDMFNALPSYRIGLKIEESIITEKDDGSILSNATGTPNYVAPGAHRFKLDLILYKIELGIDEDPQTPSSDPKFIELMVIKDGYIWRRVDKTQYNILGDTMARRTSDESGDYTVRPFILHVKECLNEGNNDGVKQKVLILPLPGESGNLVMETGYDLSEIDSDCLLSQSTAAAEVYSFNDSTYNIQYIQTSVSNFVAGLPIDSGTPIEIYKNSTKIATAYIQEVIGDGKDAVGDLPAVSAYVDQFAIQLDPGKGYVKGYEIETISPVTLLVDKARDVGQSDNQVISTYHGNAFQITDVFGIPKFEEFETLNIYDDRHWATVTGRNLIGTCKAKYFTTDRSGGKVSGQTGATYFISVFDVNLLPGQKMESAKSFISGNFKANIVCAGYEYKGNITLSGNVLTINNAGQNVFGTLAHIGDVIVINSEQPNNSVRLKVIGPDPIVNAFSVTVKKWDSTGHAWVDVADNTISDNNVVIEFAEPLLGSGNSLLYNTPHANLKRFVNVNQSSTLDNKFSILKAYSVTAVNVGGGVSTVTINTDSPNDQFDLISKEYDIVLSYGSSATLITPTSIVANSPSNNQLTISVPSSTVPNGTGCRVIAPINKVATGSTSYRTKTLTQWYKDFTNINEFQAQVLSLETTNGAAIAGIDVVRIIAIWMTDAVGGTLPAYSPTATYTNCSDIKLNYKLDSGQRDNYYDYAKLTRLVGSNNPTGSIRVIFEYYVRAEMSNAYYCVNSYSPPTNIPIYFSSYGNKFYLRDCLDFRPDVWEMNNSSTPIKLPMPNKNFTGDYEYYLNRTDKVCVDIDGIFKSIRGKSAIDPKTPETPANAMALYNLEIPAYTITAKDVTPKFIENKRYTMRDIGKLEQRIENVEYYTLLSMLEKETKDMTVLDEGGNDRHSIGFMVDPFTDDLRNDSNNKDSSAKVNRLSKEFKCCYDTSKKLMRPSYNQMSINMTQLFNSSINLTADGVVLLAMEQELLMLEQKYATTTLNLNPFEVFKSFGKIKLSPSIDNWKETIKLSPEITNIDTGAFDQLSDLTKEMGTIWDAWKVDWTGATEDTGGIVTDEDIDEDVSCIGYVFEGIGEVFKDPKLVGNGKDQKEYLLKRINAARKTLGLGAPVTSLPHPRRKIYQRMTTTTKETTTPTHRTGVELNVTEGPPLKYNLGSKVISVNNAQFMRRRLIECSAMHLLKANARVHIYFNNINVNRYCSNKKVSAGGPNHEPFARIMHNSEEAGVQTIRTDADGNIPKFYFELPCEKDIFPAADDPDHGTLKKGLRFEVGERILRLTSNPGNELNPMPDVQGEGTYSARGLIEQKRDTIVSIRNPVVTGAKQEQDGTETKTETDSYTEQYYGPWHDPIAQNFGIASSADGVFITSIDVYFKTKSQTTPVKLSIVETVNGVPGSVGPAFASVTLDPADVSTVKYSLTSPPVISLAHVGSPNDGATRFTFSTPVYLLNNTVYSFIVESVGSKDYEIWLAHNSTSEGDFIDPASLTAAEKTSQIILYPEDSKGADCAITGIEGIHSLFVSANRNDWTINSSMKLKCKIFKAKFNLGGSFQSIDDTTDTIEYILPLPGNPIQINRDPENSSDLRIYVHHPNHSFSKAGDLVEIYGLTDIKKIPSPPGAAVSVGTKELVRVSEPISLDGYFATPDDGSTWQYKDTTNFSGRCGGISAYATSQKKMDVMCLNSMTTITPAGTGVLVSGKTRKYNNNTEQFNIAKITLKDNIYFDEPMIIIAPPNNIIDPSIELTIGLTTNNPDLSPVFDMDSLHCIAVSNRIDIPLIPSVTASPINYFTIVDITVGAAPYLTKAFIVESSDNSISFPTTGSTGSDYLTYNNKFSVGKYIRFRLDGGSYFGPFMILKKEYDTTTGYFKLYLNTNLESISYPVTPAVTAVVKIQQYDYYTDEIAPADGSVSAKWPSLRVQLKNSATALYTQFAVYRSQIGNVEFYYKIKSTSDIREIDDIEYIKADTIEEMTPSFSKGEYKDYAYDIKSLEPFDLFVCKIVLKQDLLQSCDVPMIKDFRIKALAE